MKNILFILLFAVTSLNAQVDIWEGQIEKIDTVPMNDTIIYSSKNVLGKDCSCTFDASGLGKDSSYVIFGGSNLFIEHIRTKFPGFIEFPDTVYLDTTLIQTVNFWTQGDTLNINDTTHFIQYFRENYPYQVPMFKWYLNEMPEGTLRWRCLFYKRD